MSPKDLLLDFLNLIFTVALVVFLIFYFIVGGRFAFFTLFMKSMVPLAFFGIIFLVRLKITRQEIKKRKKEDNAEIILYLNVSHKLAADIIIFSIPILLGFLIYKIRGFLDATDYIILSFVFLIMFFWQRYLFSKER